VDFRKRFPLPLWRPGVDDEVDEELAFHLAMRRREMRDRGMSEAEAGRAALDRFGDLRRARRECRAIGHRRERQMRVLQYMSELRQDAAFAVRQLLASPAFTVTAVATLALGIGATTVVFSAIHAVVLRPLPVSDPERLVVISEGWRENVSRVSASIFLDVAAEGGAIEAAAARQLAGFSLAREQGADRVLGARVSGRYFDVFGVEPLVGRTFGPDEDVPGRDQVVVLGHRFWTQQFGADGSIVGREITLNNRPHTVIGVMPPSFDFTAFSEAFWVPIAFTAERIARRDEHYLEVYGRLRAGATMADASGQLAALMARRLKTYSDEDRERWLRPGPLHGEFVGEYRERLFVLLGAVGFVLLIACGNVSNLLLARGATRSRELALRGALGAGTRRLIRQLLTESLVLGLAAAAVGVALAHLLTGTLISLSPHGVPRLEQARIDLTALAFTTVLSLLVSTIFGLVPAWRAARTDVTSALKDGTRGGGSGPIRDRVRSTLIAAEVALALVLLVGAGLLIRSAVEAQRLDVGFAPQGLFTGRFQMPEVKYRDPEQLSLGARRIEEAVRAIPGVTAAAVTHNIPTVGTFNNGLLPEGKALALENAIQSDGVFVSPGYFSTLGQRIVRGRGFVESDRIGSQLVVIINETLARQMWPGEDPIGKRLTSASPEGPSTVIGVAADVRSRGASLPVPPTFYVPLGQLEHVAWSWTNRALFLVARTDGDPAALQPAIRSAISGIDPTVPLFATATMEERMADTLQRARFSATLLASLSLVGLVLAALGIYGVVAYFAAARTSELGIRMALGASRAAVLRLVVRQAAAPVLWGVALGAVGAVLTSRVIASQLVNVGTTDPLTFAAVAGALISVALLAALIPAGRAAAMDPMKALRTG
jgi:predicted permease